MNRRIFWLCAGAIMAALSLVSAGAAGVAAPGARAEAASAAAPNATRPRVGGTAIVALDQEPRVLQGWSTVGNLTATSEVLASILDSGLRYDNKAVLRPLLFDGQPVLVKRNPLTVRFRYKRAARWSDGRPITAADFRFTWQMQTDTRWDMVSRTGWEDIQSVGGGNGKTVTVVFKKPYGAWKPLVGAAVYPAHAFEGENINQIWMNDVVNPKTGRPIASGPYMFDRWNKGQQIVVVRNPNYWARKAYLSSIVYRPIPDTNTQFQALRSGEVGLLRPQPQLQIRDIKRDRRFRVQEGPEYGWEHLDLQQGDRGHPALKQRYVRQALITGINRAQLARVLYTQCCNVRVPVLQSVVFKNLEPEYRPNWARWKFNQARAIQILRSNGCTGGPTRPAANNRNIWTCPNVGRLSFRFTSNFGVNELRNLTFQIIQRQLMSIGIELRADPVVSLTPRLNTPPYDWDIFMFSWTGSPVSWATQVNLHGCGGTQNWMHYCNRTVTALLERAKAETRDAVRNQILHRADRLIAADVPTIPLLSRPGYLIHRSTLRGPLRNPTTATAYWNSGNWWTVG